MKRFLIFVSIFICLQDVAAQMTQHIIGPLPAYNGSHANTKIPYLLYTPLEVRNGQDDPNEKFPVIIALHGIGERTDQYSTMASVSTGDLVDMYTTGLPTLYQTSTSAMAGRKFAAPGRPTSEAQEFYVYAPQVWQGHSYFYHIYGDAMLDEIAKNPKADLTRVYIIGLSFGGGGVLVWLQDRNLSDRIAGAVALCAGYYRYAWQSPAGSDYPNFCNWGGLLIMGHSANDDVTNRRDNSLPLDTLTNPGSFYSDRAYDSLVNHKDCKTTVIYHKWTTGGHNVWYRWMHPNNFGLSYRVITQFNASLGTLNNIYSLLLTRKSVKRRTD